MKCRFRGILELNLVDPLYITITCISSPSVPFCMVSSRSPLRFPAESSSPSPGGRARCLYTDSTFGSMRIVYKHDVCVFTLPSGFDEYGTRTGMDKHHTIHTIHTIKIKEWHVHQKVLDQIIIQLFQLSKKKIHILFY